MDPELRDMIMSYRIPELQALLAFAGWNKQARTKHELQAKCLQLAKWRTPQVVMKMQQLYQSIQTSRLGQQLSLTGSNSEATASKAASQYYVRGYKAPERPEVRMKELPFYDIHEVLSVAALLPSVSPINGVQMAKPEFQNYFYFTPSQAAAIASSRQLHPGDKVQRKILVQLRFCLLEKDQEQDDLFPKGLVVDVNGWTIELPLPIPSNNQGVEPKQPSKPLYVTPQIKTCPTTINSIRVQWVADPTKDFAMSLLIVEKLSVDELFQRLKDKGVQPGTWTRGLIKEITTAEEEGLCAPTSIRVSVACPLGKSRMSYPCRATTCKHAQCFDAILFLRMNEQKPSFNCPVCNNRLKFGDLSIDGYFVEVIEELSTDAENEIELYPDGHWEPARKKLKMEIGDESEVSKGKSSCNKAVEVDLICLDDDVVEEDSGTGTAATAPPSSSKKCAPAEQDFIDLIDSSDEDD